MVTQPGANRTKNWLIALLVAFLLGLLPMAGLAYMRGAEAGRLKAGLEAAKLKNQIAMAALYSKRGEYEKSRQVASEFFGGLRTHLENESALPEGEKLALTSLAAQRDQVITLLSRSDPAAVERLFELQYQVAQAIPN